MTFIALGSALTVLFWGRWAGSLLWALEPSLNPQAEEQECSIRMSLYSLAAGAVILSVAAPLLYLYVILPIGALYAKGDLSLFFSPMATTYSVLTIYGLFVILGAGAAWAWREAKRSRAAQGDEVVLPYMSGIQAVKDGEMGFIGPMLAFTKADTSNYYLRRLFGERRLTIPANTVALCSLRCSCSGVPYDDYADYHRRCGPGPVSGCRRPDFRPGPRVYRALAVAHRPPCAPAVL